MATAGGIQSDDEEPQSKDERKKLQVVVNEMKGLCGTRRSRDTEELLVAHKEDNEAVILDIKLSGYIRLGPIKMVFVFARFVIDFFRRAVLAKFESTSGNLRGCLTPFMSWCWEVNGLIGWGTERSEASRTPSIRRPYLKRFLGAL